MYRVEVKPSVWKDLRRLPAGMVARIRRWIDSLASNPFPNQCVKLSNAERLWRIRVGDYRIVYEVDTAARLVIVYHVRHRREVYRGI